MVSVNEWKTRFEVFLSEVPPEKRSTSRLKWTQRHEQLVRMCYGIGQEQQTITQIGQHFYVVDGRIKHLLHQARRMYSRYYDAKAKEEATKVRRATLAEEIRVANNS